jgi:hypothetical protein
MRNLILLALAILAGGKFYASYFDKDFPLGFLVLTAVFGLYSIRTNWDFISLATENPRDDVAPPPGEMRRSMSLLQSIFIVSLLALCVYVSFWLALALLSPYPEKSGYTFATGTVTRVYVSRFPGHSTLPGLRSINRATRFNIVTASGHLELESPCWPMHMKNEKSVEVAYSNKLRNIFDGTRRIAVLRAGGRDICEAPELKPSAWRQRKLLCALLLLLAGFISYVLVRRLVWIFMPDAGEKA